MLFVFAPNANADLVAPWGTVTATACTWQFPVESAIRPAGVVQIVVTNGPAELNYQDYATGDTVWWNHSDIGVGSRLSLACSYPATSPTLTIRAFALPELPVSYTGATTPDGTEYYQPISRLSFNARGTGLYEIVMSVSQGAVKVRGDQVVGSQAVVDTGKLVSGFQWVGLTPEPGPRANWSATVRPKALAVSGAQFKSGVSGYSSSELTRLEPGTATRLEFTTSMDATVSATLFGPDGTVVRELANGFAAKYGTNAVTWDGKRADGSMPAEGMYRVVVSGVDPYGSSSTTERTILVQREVQMKLSGLSTSRSTLDRNDVAQVSYTTNLDSEVSVRVLNRSGESIRPLINRASITAGSHTVSWNGKYASGALVPDGSFFVEVSARDSFGVVDTQKVAVTVKRRMFAVTAFGYLYERPRVYGPYKYMTFQALRWRNWGQAVASSPGSLHLWICRSSCANGKMYRFPVAVTASRPRKCRKSSRWVYDTVSWRWTRTAPPRSFGYRKTTMTRMSQYC